MEKFSLQLPNKKVAQRSKVNGGFWQFIGELLMFLTQKLASLEGGLVKIFIRCLERVGLEGFLRSAFY